MTTKNLKIGFIGLGLMGRPMAKNIIKGSYPLSVYNRTKSKTLEFKKLGATVYDSPAELSRNVDVVITMVTAPKDVREVILRKNGVMEGASKNTIVVDMSTIGPSAAREIGKELKKKGISFLDAPVTGSTMWAESGTLTILVGGEKKVFEKVKPVFEAMGKGIFYIGPSGSGQAIKLVNNLMGGITVAAVAEGMLLADALGLPRKAIVEALSEVPVVSMNMKYKMPLMVKEKFPVAFSMSNMRKDLKLALDESSIIGGSKKKKLPLLEETEKLLKKGIDEGLGEEDYSAVLKILKKG